MPEVWDLATLARKLQCSEAEARMNWDHCRIAGTLELYSRKKVRSYFSQTVWVQLTHEDPNAVN